MSRAAALTRCPVPGCPNHPVPWFCPVHWPFISSEVRHRIVRFTKTMRGNGEGELPITLKKLLAQALVDISNFNTADRLAFRLHQVVCGGWW